MPVAAYFSGKVGIAYESGVAMAAAKPNIQPPHDGAPQHALRAALQTGRTHSSVGA